MSDKIGCQIDGHPAHGVLFEHLIVSKIVINIYGGNGQARDFTIHVGRNHQQADTFPGSETGIDVTLGFGSYRVTDEIHSSVLSQDTLSQYSTDCSRVIHSDETKTRTIANLEIQCYY